MRSIFYDLETSDTTFMGQILNYCFTEVDNDFNAVSSCSGLVRISELELPSPEAILANRTNVIEHQKLAKLSEREALAQIHHYIGTIVKESKDKVPLIGFNSNRFDLPFLRTSLIRNGLNPYFSGNLVYRDMLHCVRKLYVERLDFPSPRCSDKLSLTMESVCHALGLLSKAQSHFSADDVELTIKLAAELLARFGLDVRSYEAYEARKLHPQARKGQVYLRTSVNYEHPDLRRLDTPHTLLDADHRSALWINLERFKSNPDRGAISWLNTNTHLFILREGAVSDEILQLAQSALTQLGNLNLKNFFEVSDCDIEQDIYRLDFDSIEALRRAIWEGETSAIRASSPRDLRTIWTRYKLRNMTNIATSDQEQPERKAALLRQYGNYRYGGHAKLTRWNVRTAVEDNESDNIHYHRTYRDLNQSIEELRTAAQQSGRELDLELLGALQSFYRSSALYQACHADFEQEIAATNPLLHEK